MKHFFSSFALTLGLALPVLAACGGATSDVPGASGDGTATGGSGNESVDTADSDVKSGKKQSCASVGGACVGLAPSSCADGHWADASKVSCGGGVGVACCISCPVLSPPAPGFCPDGKIVPIKNANGCTGGFDCVPPAGNACTAAGGTCVGLAPASCASGHWGDASTHSCGGGLGVGCCLP